MISLNQKMKYTIRICDLNRINLIQSRRKIIGNFLNELDEDLISFEKYIKKDNDNFEKFINLFEYDENRKEILLVAFYTFKEGKQK
ncbi:MAG: hypothetical protein Q9M39_04500 [Sulfurovum sp.]|nr:hypothetical protein [Sulfurovum sp.]